MKVREEKLRRSLIFITSGGTGGEGNERYPQPRSGLNRNVKKINLSLFKAIGLFCFFIFSAFLRNFPENKKKQKIILLNPCIRSVRKLL